MFVEIEIKELKGRLDAIEAALGRANISLQVPPEPEAPKIVLENLPEVRPDDVRFHTLGNHVKISAHFNCPDCLKEAWALEFFVQVGTPDGLTYLIQCGNKSCRDAGRGQFKATLWQDKLRQHAREISVTEGRDEAQVLIELRAKENLKGGR
jgi:hypothetical protein